MTSYELDNSAYHLLLLHAKKYKHSITGLLLGRKQGSKVSITRALPLAHSEISILTTPLTEVSLHLTEQYASENSLSLAGIYFSNEIIDDPTLPTHILTIANKIVSRFPDAIVLRIDGMKLKPMSRCTQHCLIPHCGERWKPVTFPNLVSDIALRTVEQALRIPGVADFEDHLLDPTADWLNVNVLAALNAVQTLP